MQTTLLLILLGISEAKINCGQYPEITPTAADTKEETVRATKPTVRDCYFNTLVINSTKDKILASALSSVDKAVQMPPSIISKLINIHSIIQTVPFTDIQAQPSPQASKPTPKSITGCRRLVISPQPQPVEGNTTLQQETRLKSKFGSNGSAAPSSTSLQDQELYELEERDPDSDIATEGAGSANQIPSSIPLSNFRCVQHRFPGLYADAENGCQTFHICHYNGHQDTFTCPNGSLFNQRFFVCDWWYNVDCSQTSIFFGLNKVFHIEPTQLRQVASEITHHPLKQPGLTREVDQRNYSGTTNN